MIGFDDAFALLRETARPLDRETVPVAAAHGRVLADPVEARIAAPRADTSAMDGFAVRDSDLAKLPVRLPIAERIFAGHAGGASLAPGSCARIFTGAPVPEGADRVIVQEEVREEAGDALFSQQPGPARHIRRRGSDFETGDILLEDGRLLDARAVVAAAAADVAEIRVWRQPRVRILGTGDELVPPGQARSTPGAIPESVSLGIAAMVTEGGGLAAPPVRLRDEREAMGKAAAEAVRQADLVVVTGGASVGEKDFAKAMFEDQDLRLLFSKVAIKPGKPVWLGRARSALVLGLPGNPTSALVTARLFLAPLLAGLTGRDPASALQWRRMPLAAALEGCGGRETFVRARSDRGEALPLPHQDSSAQRTLAEADLLIRRRPSAPPSAAGDMVEVLDF